jgi:hypothetical protein
MRLVLLESLGNAVLVPAPPPHVLEASIRASSAQQ